MSTAKLRGDEQIQGESVGLAELKPEAKTWLVDPSVVGNFVYFDTVTGGLADSGINKNASAQYKYLVAGATPFLYAESPGALNIAANKTLTISETLTLTAAGASASLTLPNLATTIAAAGAYTLTIPESLTVAGRDVANTFTVQQIFSGTLGDVATDIPLKLIRNTNETSIGTSSVFGKAVSSGNMADGFGIRYLFAIQDNAGVENVIGAFGAIREGADNAGKLIFQTTASGSGGLTTYATINKNGCFGIGNDSVSALTVYRNLPAPDDLGDFDNYQLVIWGHSDTGDTAGVLFSTSIDTQGGSAIVHYDTGSGGLGDLVFYTKQATTAIPPVEILRLTSAAAISMSTGGTGAGINNSLTIANLGSGAAGDGGSINLAGKSSTIAATAMGLIDWRWIVATHASRTAALRLYAYDTAARLGMEIEASGSEVKTAVNGATPVVRATHIADATDAASAITQLNLLLAAIENFGILKTS